MNLSASSMAFVAVATTSHASMARMALESVRSRSPIRKYLFLVGSAGERRFSGAPGVEEVHVEDVVRPDVIRRLVSRYTPEEVCFALKPFVLEVALKEETCTSAHYVDADLKFFALVDGLADSFDGGDILLTPHYLRPFPHDGRRPHVLALLRGGVFNAGYVGVRRAASGFAFLEWWGQSVLDYGKNEPRNGTSGDQRWLDLVPALFPTCTVWRNPGANVGYWNLHERKLIVGPDGQLQVDGQPLLFFHFSGFDSRSPGQLSKYQDRIDPCACPEIGKLLAEYAAELGRAGVMSGERGGAYAYRKWWHGDSWLIRLMRKRMRRHW